MNSNDKQQNFIDEMLGSIDDKSEREKLSNAVKSGDANSLLNSLSPENKKKVNSILENKNALAELIKSPQAAAILKKLAGRGTNG